MFKGLLKKRLTKTALPTLQLSQSLQDDSGTIIFKQDNQPDGEEAATMEPIIRHDIKKELTEDTIKVEPTEIENTDEQDKIEIDIKYQIFNTVKQEPTNKQHVCEVCNETFETELELNEHTIENPGCKHQQAYIKDEPQDETEDIYVCSVCNEMYESKEELINHKKETAICHEHKICDKCEVKSETSESDFTCTWELDDHLRTAHGVQDRDALSLFVMQEPDNPTRKNNRPGKGHLRCRFCPKSFHHAASFQMHERMHTDTKQCAHCGKTFYTHALLKKHLEIHSRKNFACKFCPKSFLFSSKLAIHERSHTGEKPYRCPVCEKSFTASWGLKEHIEGVHGTGEEAVPCGSCRKSFTSIAKLRRHERTHDGARPYQCRFCKKTFADGWNLKIHERQHTGERPFACGTCDEKFTRKSALSKHERSHTDEERPHVCDVCKAGYTRESSLKRHKIQVHASVDH